MRGFQNLDPAAQALPLAEIEVRVPGRKGVKVKTRYGVDQID